MEFSTIFVGYLLIGMLTFFLLGIRVFLKYKEISLEDVLFMVFSIVAWPLLFLGVIYLVIGYLQDNHYKIGKIIFIRRKR